MKMIINRIIIWLSLLFCIVPGCFPSPACASYIDTGTIHIGVLANQGKDECFSVWDPTAAYLKKSISGYNVQIVCLDFDEVEGAVRDRHVDFTITNPQIYVNLEYSYGSSRISTLKNRLSPKSRTRMGGVLFYRSDRTDIKSIADLKGKKFMAVDENSFGGWIVSWRYLKNRGIDPRHDFKELLFGGRHDAVVLSVLNGSVDAGCVRTDVLERMAWEQRIALRDLVIFPAENSEPDFDMLRTTRLYPEWPMAKARHTDEELAKNVAMAMMRMPEESLAARFSRIKGWTIPLDYNEVHDCLRELKVAPYVDFGRITLGRLYQQYKYWINVGLIFLVCTFAGVTIILKLNRRLKGTLTQLDALHRQRELVMADLDDFKKTLDQALDCIFMFSGDSLSFIYANQGALDHIAYSREELLEMTVLEIKPEFTESQFRAKIAPLIEDAGKSLTFVTQHRRKDGTLVPVEIFLQYITPPRKAGHFVAIVRDISVRLQEERERELLRTRLLQEQKMASVGQLAAGIAHEINTPAQYLGSNIDFLGDAFSDVSTLISRYERLLVAAKNFEVSQSLLDAVQESVDAADWEYLKTEIPQALSQSAEGVRQVSSIVGAMKNFANPGSVTQEMTDLNELLEVTLTVSRNEWKYVAELVLHLEPGLPVVPCLRNEIGQVFLNIIVNAAQSIAEKFGITYPYRDHGLEEKGRIEISSASAKESVVITVADSGCGIPRENLSRIFDPFYTTKEVGRGSGQGLAIVYDVITNKHHGSIEVESEEGVGTTFTIRLAVGQSRDRDRGEGPAG
jgi:phosphate/phosphite/phosphonate ABC transporter binding protein